MTLLDLKQRVFLRSRQIGLTYAAHVRDYGLTERALDLAIAGKRHLRVETAAKLLPLVATVTRPGEAVALTLHIPGVPQPVLLTIAPFTPAPAHS